MCYVASWDGDERACYSTMEVQCPWVLFMAAAARAARALGEAGRGASPTTGKREGRASRGAFAHVQVRGKGFPS